MDFSILFWWIAMITTLILLYYQWIFGYWKRNNVETLPPNLIFGNLDDLIFGKIAVSEIFGKLYRKFKPKGYKYVGFYAFMKPMLVVLDPKLVEQIFIKDFSYFTDHTLYINKKVDPLSANLLNMKGTEWKHTRRILTPAFTANKLKIILDQVLKIANNLITNLNDSCENSKMVEVKDISSKFIIDVIGTSFLGIDCNLLLNQNNEFNEVVNDSLRGSLWQQIKIIISVYYPTILSRFGVRLNYKKTEDFFTSITKQTVDYREKNKVKINDFMQLLIKLRNNMDIEKSDNMDLLEIGSEGREKLLSIQEIAAEVYLFFVAGSETSSSTIAFCLFELVQNPKIYEKLKNEIHQVLDKHNGEINYNALMEMTYLDTCVKETLRKYPPIPQANRECTKDWSLSDTDLEITTGETVCVPILELHYDEEYYPNPEQFDPDRFSSENKSKIPSGAYLPFGDGPRSCIGMRFAFLLIKTAITILLNNYKLTLNPRTTIPLEKDKGSFSGTKSGIWMDVEKIRNL